MNLSSPPTVLEKINFRAFVLLLFLFQVIFIFQGIDLSDEGFYATFYQQIFDHPESAQYNFMFWFSGIVGGTVHKLAPWLGLWGIRLAGVLVTTSTIVLTYNLLKDYLHKGYLKLGLLLVLLFINNNLKMVHYNDLSALLNMAVIFFLFRGIKQDKKGKLAIAGALVALSTFTRLPNVLCLGLALAIIVHGWWNRRLLKAVVTDIVVFGLGFVVAAVVILAIMKLIGHLDIFLNSVRLLSKMGSGGDDSFYGPMVLIRNFLVSHIGSIKYAVIILLLLLSATIGGNYLKRIKFYQTWMGNLVRVGAGLAIAWLMIRGTIQKETMLYFYVGLTLIVTVLIVFGRNDQDLKLLALMGLFILLSFPFSSSAGIFTVGIYSLWLSFPIVIDYLFSARSLTGQLTLFRQPAFDQGGFTITEDQLRQMRGLVVALCIFGSLVQIWRYPFFDRHDRLAMRSSIDCRYLGGIYTTRERAQALNELMHASEPYVKEDAYLLAYQCTPMLNYMTHTIPYMRNSYPWLYDAETFRTELNKGLEETKQLPVVVMQKIKTIGASSNWPDPTQEDVKEYERKNAVRNQYMNEFLTNHSYREVWSNSVFALYVPAQP